jgi:hypothetical protein
MIESPLIKEIVAESVQNTIIEVLSARFGEVPEDTVVRLRRFTSEKRLNALARQAGVCRDITAFAALLSTPRGGRTSQR